MDVTEENILLELRNPVDAKLSDNMESAESEHDVPVGTLSRNVTVFPQEAVSLEMWLKHMGLEHLVVQLFLLTLAMVDLHWYT